MTCYRSPRAQVIANSDPKSPPSPFADDHVLDTTPPYHAEELSDRSSEPGTIEDVVTTIMAHLTVRAEAKLDTIRKSRPRVKYYDRDEGGVKFEPHFALFESIVNVLGVDEKTKLGEVPHWFGGRALAVLQPILSMAGENKALAWEKAKQSLQAFGCFCPVCPFRHTLDRCPTFFSRTIGARQRLCRETGICLRCLIPGHNAPVCSATTVCESCSSPEHHTIVHPYPANLPFPRRTDLTCFHPLFSVTISYEGQSANTYAAIWPYADRCIISPRIVQRHRIKTKDVYVKYTTSNDWDYIKAQVCDFNVVDVKTTRYGFTIKRALVLDWVRSYYENIPPPTNEEISEYEHLKGIHLEDLEDKSVDFMMDSSQAGGWTYMRPERTGVNGLPHALETPMGWIFQGQRYRRVLNPDRINSPYISFQELDVDEATFRMLKMRRDAEKSGKSCKK